MSGMESVANRLSIVIVTYNRAVLLEKTLMHLFGSPFKECEIVVLNNCSTDDTIEICSKYADKYRNFSVVTNAFNIGGDANILRALEKAKRDFLWILADDDEYDFSFCDDVVMHICKGDVDLIHVGAHMDVAWSFCGNFLGAKDLVSNGYSFFRFSSFIPCNIFRVSSFLPYVIDGYRNIINMYSHMPFLLSFYLENKPIYISENRIVKAVIGHQNYGAKAWLNAWIETSFLLKKRKDVCLCFFDQMPNCNKVKVLWSYSYGCLNGLYHIRTIYRVFSCLCICWKSIYLLGLAPACLFLAIKNFNK